jgi:hypothetical protein
MHFLKLSRATASVARQRIYLLADFSTSDAKLRTLTKALWLYCTGHGVAAPSICFGATLGHYLNRRHSPVRST